MKKLRKRKLIDLKDNSILQADSAIALWAFAHGDDDPHIEDACRKAMHRGLHCGDSIPLHIAMGIPPSSKACQLHVRNTLLRRAATMLDGKFNTSRKMAKEMRRITPHFIEQIAPAWFQLGIPSSAREIDRLLCLVYLTGCDCPKSIRQWQSIISGEV